MQQNMTTKRKQNIVKTRTAAVIEQKRKQLNVHENNCLYGLSREETTTKQIKGVLCCDFNQPVHHDFN